MVITPRADHPIFASAAMRIGGERIGSGSEGELTHISPVNGGVLGAFPVGGAVEADAAIQSARIAQRAWIAMPNRQRRDLLLSAARMITARAEELATIASHETGALFNPAAMAAGTEHLTYYAGWIDKIEGATIPLGAGVLDYTTHEPYGVVLGITSWNGPITSALMKLGPALAAGNAVIVKPPELGPFATMVLADIFEEAGLPPGLFNVVTGGAATAQALIGDPRIGKISFTGGLSTARHVLRGAAENATPVVTELGGKSANLVFADADLDRAAGMAAMMGCVVHAGQGCLFPTRLLVEDAIYDRFVGKVVDIVRAARVGSPFEAGTVTGPVISQGAVDRILARIADARQAGEGKLLAGGERLDGELLGGDLANGYYVAPTVFGDVANDAGIAREEVFGPVLSIIRFSDEADAVAKANDSSYGLAGYVHTTDLGRAHRVAGALEAGYIGVNAFPPMPVQAPFGGYKQSGSGREGGRAGIEEFLRTKNIYIPWG
ncbi:aldehyde dehydrogenase (NAD+) [Sphingobium faniae]|nr:aldehyde dehydrogenase (NAD+) [Sphingobium faniae]